MSKEQYFYGQGKVFLAKRNADGTPGAFRWVGDVSELNFELTTEDLTHKESYSGQKTVVRRFNISKEGSLSAIFHDHNADNLALLLYSEVAAIPAGSASKTLPDTISVGDIYSLDYIKVSNITIPALTEGTDYQIDSEFGMIEFLTPQTSALVVAFDYEEQKSAPMFNKSPEDVYLRYNGINLAENGAPVIAEFYKVQFSPASGLNLINNDSSLAGLSTTAGVLYDTTKKIDDPKIGKYGRIVTVG